MIKHDAHVSAWECWHPGDPRTVMVAYRKFILARKRQWGSARGLVYYRRMILTYLHCKRRLTA